MFSGQNIYLGLDIGASGTKAVLLRRVGKALVWETAGQLDLTEEGILSDKEMYQSIFSWLKEQQWHVAPLTLGVPQYLSTTLVTDFPVADAKALRSLVSHEAQQLASLSDEAFVHDFQLLPAGCGRRNPVLIGLCREQMLRERLRWCAEAGIRHDDLAMTGLAMINAFGWCRPREFKSDKPVLLLDLGKENSTAVVLAGGRPLFIGALLFSADRLQQAFSESAGTSRKWEEKKSLEQVNLLDEAPTSELLQVARQLEVEIHNAVEHWRNQEQPEMVEVPIEEVYLCGGGSKLGGLADWLADRLESRVQPVLLAPQGSQQIQPEYAVALGLALQSAGEAAVKLSLLPLDVAWRQLRQRRWPWLAAALALLILTVFGLELAWWRNRGKVLKANQLKVEQLSQCGQSVQAIEQLQTRLLHLEKRLAPLVILGNNASRAAEAVVRLGQACGEEDWFVYLADECSYQDRRVSPEQTSRVTGRSTPPRAASMFGQTHANLPAEQASSSEFPFLLDVSSFPAVTSYIAAGYTPLQGEQPFAPIRALVHNLNASRVYRDVDQLSEHERMGREDVFRPWMNFLQQMPQQQFKSFIFRLLLAEPELRPGVGRTAGRTEK